jgi:hypothetical protein
MDKLTRIIELAKYAFIHLLICSCVTPYPVDSLQFQEAIVVQGMITDQPGPYEIKVSKTIPVQDQLEPTSGLLSGASILIEDDQGHSNQLVEKTTGDFFTTSIQGVIGNTYTITITTSDGNVYKSTPEKLLPVGDFNIEYEFKQVEDTLAKMQITSANGFNIFIDSNVRPEQEGRVWWRSTGTYHVLTFPGNRRTWANPGPLPPPTGPPAIQVPDPPRCAGTDADPVCTCCDCWITDYNLPMVSKPTFIHNGQINNLKVAFIQANRRTLHDKYSLEIDQLSVSQAVYDFWKRMSIIQSNTSNLFQTPEPKVGGNLAASTKNAVPIIGYFAASSIVRKTIVVTRQNVPYRILDIDEIDDNCLSVFRNSTNKKPSFW